MAQYPATFRGVQRPRVAIFGLASCFGCQLQITNNESQLTSVLSHIELSYWQLVDNASLPSEFDIAFIEGAVSTEQARTLVQEIRRRARVVVGMGACALTAGIPGISVCSYTNFEQHAHEVYGKKLPRAAGTVIAPTSVKSVIDVDYEIPCCPIDFDAFVSVLNHVLYGSNKTNKTTTMCGECKAHENECLFERGQMCMGLVTNAGCKARCPSLGRPCNGCAGVSPDANIASACNVVALFGHDARLFTERLGLFNAHACESHSS